MMRSFPPTRRDVLFGLGAGLGTIALNAIVQAEQATGPLSPRPPHHRAKAKACIFLFMEGGPSHLDTFDPKPELERRHLQEFVRRDRFASAMASGRRYFVRSPFAFRRAGQSGLTMNAEFEHLAQV